MSGGFQASAHVERPVEAVWRCLTDWNRAPEWMTGIDEMRPADGAAAGEGSRLKFRSRGTDRDTLIVVWSPPERLALRSVQGGMTATYEYTCAPERDGTRVTLNARCEAKGLGWRMVSPLIRLLMKRADSGQVAALKRLVETSPA